MGSACTSCDTLAVIYVRVVDPEAKYRFYKTERVRKTCQVAFSIYYHLKIYYKIS